MMTYRIICVGKLKEKFYAEACREYCKRLSRHAKVEIIELGDEKAPENLSLAQMEQVKRAEGERILSKLNADEYKIALAIDGQTFTSEGLAQKLQSLMNGGVSRIALVIGGSLGLSDEVLRAVDLKLSFSCFTFCHQLMRVILLEQVYRATKILANEPYHK